jgi:hypothetical protein
MSAYLPHQPLIHTGITLRAIERLLEEGEQHRNHHDDLKSLSKDDEEDFEASQ